MSDYCPVPDCELCREERIEQRLEKIESWDRFPTTGWGLAHDDTVWLGGRPTDLGAFADALKQLYRPVAKMVYSKNPFLNMIPKGGPPKSGTFIAGRRAGKTNAVRAIIQQTLKKLP